MSFVKRKGVSPKMAFRLTLYEKMHFRVNCCDAIKIHYLCGHFTLFYGCENDVQHEWSEHIITSLCFKFRGCSSSIKWSM